MAELTVAAYDAALAHARAIESNVVQDRVIRESLQAAIKVLIPYLVIPTEPTRSWWHR